MNEKQTVPDALLKVNKYYQKPGNECGGNLHVVLDDRNLNNHNIGFCRKECIKNNDQDGLVLCDLLSSMTLTQRKKLYRGTFQ